MNVHLPLTDVHLTPELYFVIPGELKTLTGGYAYDRELMTALRHAGIIVHHVTLSGQFPTPDESALADAGAQLAAIPDQALVLIDGLAYGVMDTLAAREHHRLRIIALCHHPLALETGLTDGVKAALLQSERTALTLACAVVVTSSATASLLTERFDVSADKITVALPGTGRPAFAPCRGQPPCLLTVATLTRRKAHDVLISALSRVEALPWRARFVGGDQFDPAWSAQLRTQVADLGLGERIQFAGSVDDLNTEYAAADVFVLPSRFEGYGMVFAEALSYGLPVIAAHAGAVPDVVPDSAGILVAPDDADKLAAALHAILSTPSHFAALRRGAQAAAAQLPQWQNTANQLIAVLQTVAQQQVNQQT